MLANKIFLMRQIRKLSQSELAKKSGLSQATISRLEAGRISQLKSDAIIRLARALWVTTDFLLDVKKRNDIDVDIMFWIERNSMMIKKLASMLLKEERAD